MCNNQNRQQIAVNPLSRGDIPSCKVNRC